MDNQDFENFIKSVNNLTSIDLSQYKEVQMKRRLTTLRNKKGFDTFADFFTEMAKDKNVLVEFLDRMTINVSEFFRNRNRWDVLGQSLIPLMLNKHQRIKCWSAACSTGEEPYTLAMVLSKLKALDKAQIIATDLDENALTMAKRGEYFDRSLKEVLPNDVETFFTKEESHYTVDPSLRNNITFKKQNLLTDSFESNFDLIICRNVMIYFTELAKQDLYKKFAQALKPGGILFVGSTEQIFNAGQYGLEAVETFFYRKKLN